MTWSLWLIMAILLFISEIAGVGMFFFACLGIGALFTAVIVLFTLPFWMQWVSFLLVSLLSVYLIRPVAMRFFKPKDAIKSNVDALIGKKALATETIEPKKSGMIKVNGEVWRAEADEFIEANSWVEIAAVDGAHLHVKKVRN